MDLLSVLSEVLTPKGGWSLEFVVRVVLSTLLVFTFVVVIARTFGPRTFASFTTFDFLINVASGSLVASSILGQNLMEGALALLSLALVQGAVSRASAASRTMHDLVDNPPVVLVERGRILKDGLLRGRVSEQSLMQQLRSQGVADLGNVRLAVLESGGTVSVITGSGEGQPDTFPPRSDRGRT